MPKALLKLCGTGWGMSDVREEWERYLVVSSDIVLYLFIWDEYNSISFSGSLGLQLWVLWHSFKKNKNCFMICT